MTRVCSDCAGPVGPKNISGRCNSCFHGMGRRDGIVAMHREGKSYAEIARSFSMSKQAIYGVLRRVGAIGQANGQDHSLDWQNRRAAAASRALLLAYQRHFAGLPPAPVDIPQPALSGRPSTVGETISRLDALSRTRALTLSESLELEAAIHADRNQTCRNRREVRDVVGVRPLA